MFGVLAISGSLSAQSDNTIREEIVRIPGPLKGLKLALHHAVLSQATGGAPRPIVIILPGAGVAVSENPGYKIGGTSLMTALAARGMDVWALDYYGFGESDLYPEMNQPADKHAALGPAEESADQVDSAVAFLTSTRGVQRVLLIGDSGGTIVAGVFATRRPELVSRLILFGPVTPFTEGPQPGTVVPAYSLLTPREIWTWFTDWSNAVGTPAVLDSTVYPAWAAAYLRSDPTSGTRTPPSVRIPNGRSADLAMIAAGRFPYDPGAIRAPTLIVMGEWDAIATFAGAEWLLKRMRRAPQRRLTVIGNGSHTIQYEKERTQLYDVVADFLLPR